MVAEPGLDGSSDPAALIVADLPAIDASIHHLRSLGGALERTAKGLRGIEVGQWSGEAADAFRARFDESPARWFAAADAFSDAATAFDGFRRTVVAARSEATRAVELYRSGTAASETAVREHNAAVDAFNAQVTAGGQPAPLPEFTDPGVAMKEQAAQILASARRERDDTGAIAAQVVQAAAATAPDPPTGWDRAAKDSLDWIAEGEQYMTGLGEGVMDLVTTAQTLNPTNPANVLHPASYVENLNSMAAGAVTSAAHPAEMVKSMTGTGWGSDPFGALGRAVPSVALSAVSGGAGGVAGALGRGAARAGRVVPHPRPHPGSVPPALATAEGGAGPDRPPANTEDAPTLPYRAQLSPWFWNEQYGRSMGFPGQSVRYFDDADREEARLTVHDGRLYDVDGKPFSSETGGSLWSDPDEVRSIFVMDPKGNLYVSNHQEKGVMHHSSFLAGGPVAGAGEIEVVDGRVQFMSDQSGHYRPPGVCLDQVVDYLRNEGVNLDNVTIERTGH